MESGDPRAAHDPEVAAGTRPPLPSAGARGGAWRRRGKGSRLRLAAPSGAAGRASGPRGGRPPCPGSTPSRGQRRHECCGAAGSGSGCGRSADGPGVLPGGRRRARERRGRRAQLPGPRVGRRCVLRLTRRPGAGAGPWGGGRVGAGRPGAGAGLRGSGRGGRGTLPRRGLGRRQLGVRRALRLWEERRGEALSEPEVPLGFCLFSPDRFWLNLRSSLVGMRKPSTGSLSIPSLCSS